MDSCSTDGTLFLDILKRCFASADNVRIVHQRLEDGDLHFTSSVTRIVVEYEQDGRTHRKQLVVKVPASTRMGAVFESLDFFYREICVYEQVLPRMRKYLDESLTAALVHATESRILLLEDLTGLGYESGEKLAFLDFSRAEAVLEAFAHFHAASHQLHAEDPHFLRHLLATHVAAIEFRRTMTKLWAPVVLRLLERRHETSLAAKVRLAVAFLEQDDGQLRALVDQSAFKFVVLNHGDGRKDNVLLKFDPQGRVQSVRLIDFQASVWSSPLFDLFYFLTTSVLVDVVEAHWDDLIDGYLRELNGKLEKLGSASTYSKADFHQDYRILRFYLFFCVLCLCHVISPLDRSQKENILLEPEPDVSHLCRISFDNENFVNSVYRWLKYCEKSNVFDGFSNTCGDSPNEVPLGRL